MTPHTESESQIDLREFLGVVRRRWLSIALVTLLVVGTALALVSRRIPEYSSTARVEVRPLMAGGDLQTFYVDVLANMDTEAQRVTSQGVVTLAGAQLGVVGEGEELGPDELETLTDDVSTAIPANTAYIDITCTKLEPAEAQSCADAFAGAYVDDREALAQRTADAARRGVEEQIDASEQRIEVLRDQMARLGPDDAAARTDLADRVDLEERAIDTARLQLLGVPAASPNPAQVALPAPLPDEPSNKDYVTTGLLAGVVGLALGIGLAFVRERLDERLGHREGMEAAIGAPVLAVVPRVSSWRNRNEARLVTLDAPDTVTAEAYRTARTTLMYTSSREDIKVLLVTGPGEGDGKSTTTANLAAALAQIGKRVIVISADLRKPRLHRFLGLDSSVGLTEVLQHTATVREAISSTMLQHLKAMSSDTIAPNPAELLSSETMDDVLATLRPVADFVLIDTPPSLVVADALELAPKVDGIIVVVDGSKTTRQAAIHLRHQLERVGGLIVGGILNNLDPGQESPYGRYYSSQDSSYRKPTRKARKKHARTASIDEPFVGSEPEEIDWHLAEPGSEVMDVQTPGPADEPSPNNDADDSRPSPDVAEWR